MENKGLLFIPDISGFTRFINESEIEHSRLIIQELLELLLNANQLALEVSEIEGDAILFYKFGDAPNIKDLFKQVEKMFWAFHRHLNTYERGRFCQCRACMSAANLSLKIITHYGEFTDYSVKNFNKLIGRDVIIAHQLLKNNIEQHEYWLVTKSLLPNDPPIDLSAYLHWDKSAKQIESGEVPFYYTQLGPLKDIIPPEPLPLLDLSKKVKVLSVSQDYKTDMITLFHAAGDLRYRSQWQVGVKEIKGIEHILPRVGMRYQAVHEDEQTVAYYSSCSYHPEHIAFSETDEKKETTTYYILEKKEAKLTKLTLTLYLKKSPFTYILYQLSRKDKEATYSQSLINLEKVVEKLNQSEDGW